MYIDTLLKAFFNILFTGMQMIDIRNLSKSYGSYKALDDISFHIGRDGVIAFLGPNGAGKSTLLRIMTGYLPFDSGTVRICGTDIKDDPLAVKSCVGYLPESNPLYEELRVTEFLNFRAGVKGISAFDRAMNIERSLELTGITHVRGRIISQLSKGYRQRVGIADSLLGNPQLIILDEPMVGLDPNQLREMKKMIIDLGREKTVFLSTHILQDVEELCRELVIINKGQLLAVDTPRNLIEKNVSTRSLYLEAAVTSDILSEIQSLPSVLTARMMDGENYGSGRFVIDTGKEIGCRNEIIDLFRQKGLLFQELRLEPVGLADIFAEVTGGAAKDSGEVFSV